MPNFSKGTIVLVRYPFSDQTAYKVRPAIVISAVSTYSDLFVVPLTSRTGQLSPGEFQLHDWQQSGLNVPSVVKRGIALIEDSVILKVVGTISTNDFALLQKSIKTWLELQ